MIFGSQKELKEPSTQLGIQYWHGLCKEGYIVRCLYEGENFLNPISADPLRFMQQTLRSLGKEMPSDWQAFGCTGFLGASFRRIFGGFGKHDVSVSLEKGGNYNFKPYHARCSPEEKDLCTRFVRSLTNPQRRMHSKCKEFRMGEHDFSFFGKYRTAIGLRLSYFTDELRAHKGTPSADFHCDINFHNGGYALTWFSFDEWNRRRTLPGSITAAMEDILTPSYDNNWQPLVHRMFELYYNIPRHEWHDPAIYRPRETLAFPQTLQAVVHVLFGLEERSELEEKIRATELTVRNGWCSIPKLNLGNVRIPTPGVQDVARDEFVISAAPLLVEYLARLSVMCPDEAEDLVTRKLTNYFVQRRGFQLSPDNARTILGKLQEAKTA